MPPNPNKAYHFFLKEFCPEFRKTKEKFTKVGVLQKKCSKRWSTMSAIDKEPYVQMLKAERLRKIAAKFPELKMASVRLVRLDEAEIERYLKPDSAEQHEDARENVPEPTATTPSVTDNNMRYLHMLKDQLVALLEKPILLRPISSFPAEAEDPAAQALFWISDWVNSEDGFVYRLSDDSVGVAFPDGTKLIMLANKIDLRYVERDGSEQDYKLAQYPTALNKKMKLLDEFRRDMVEDLVRAGSNQSSRESDSMARMPPYLSNWFMSPRINCAIMFLTNGTFQIIFSNHNKLIICPLMEAVTHITSDNVPHTYRFSTIEAHGCCEELYTGLETAQRKVCSMISTVQGAPQNTAGHSME